MKPDQLTRKIRHHYAISVIGPSTSRGMIQVGDIKYVRDFLDRLDLRRFSDPGTFDHALDRATQSLAKLLPKGGWGAARKFLNIYLRAVTYNYYLRRAYKLAPVERMLELPMDKFAAEHLRRKREGRTLPKWEGVIHLTREANAQYQATATLVAARKHIHRVHLDVLFWRAPYKA
jgi:hypothetical protein